MLWGGARGLGIDDLMGFKEDELGIPEDRPNGNTIPAFPLTILGY